ncbi:unnamed protein product, partial [Gulo gulo]
MLLAAAGRPSHSGAPAHPPLHPYIHSCGAHTVSEHRDCLWLLATYHPESGTLSHVPGACLSAPTPHLPSPSWQNSQLEFIPQAEPNSLPGRLPHPHPALQKGGPQATPSNPIPELDFNPAQSKTHGRKCKPRYCEKRSCPHVVSTSPPRVLGLQLPTRLSKHPAAGAGGGGHDPPATPCP